MNSIKLLAALLFSALSAAAAASVTINADGTGFIGKGDVQLPFGWNNATMQANATAVTFAYAQSNNYNAVCEWVTGEGTKRVKVHQVTLKRSTDVVSSLAADPRKTGQYTGWNLTGFGAHVSAGATPQVGGECLGEGLDAAYTEVELTSTSTQLTATVDGVTREIIITPIAIPL